MADQNKGTDETVQYLKYQIDETILPALKEIQQAIKDGAYVNPKDLARVENIANAVDVRTRNYAIVEKVVFGLVGVILLAFITAIVGLVIVGKH